MSLNQDPTTTPNNPIQLFEGTDDYTKTRSYGKWLDRDYVSVKKQDYVNIYELETIYFEPWSERVYLDGTDGN